MLICAEMSKKPVGTTGTLIFQQGKDIEGEFYIIAVYDDPASCTISFSAYELENDCTYTLPLTYAEFDGYFVFDSELMNPSHQDGRFSWVIDRLDFIRDHKGQKVLVLTPEPTNEPDENAVVEKPKAKGITADVPTGKIDAATRAKLLKELDTQDDRKLHAGLVRSEDARKRFLKELFSRRALQQLKATQRMLKADEEREARLARLEIIRSQQLAKAQAHREGEAAKASVQKNLEDLLKKKEAYAIRRLIQEKDEQDRGMGREKDAARQKRQMQARSANDLKQIEKGRARQLERQREEKVLKREQAIQKANLLITNHVRELKEEQRAIEVTRQEAKDAIVEAEWTRKAQVMQGAKAKQEQFEALEDVRDRVNEDLWQRRSLRERDRITAEREDRAIEEREVLRRRESERKEQELTRDVEFRRRMINVQEQAKRDKGRDRRIFDAREESMKLLRERQFLEQANARVASPRGGFGSDDKTMLPDELATVRPPDGAPPDASELTASKDEMDRFQKTFEQQERQRRQREREERRQALEGKRDKVKLLGSKNPNEREIERAVEWRRAEAQHKKEIEDAQTKKELAQEEAQRIEAEKVSRRQELWERLEGERRARSRDHDMKRNTTTIRHVKALPMGTGLPRILAF